MRYTPTDRFFIYSTMLDMFESGEAHWGFCTALNDIDNTYQVMRYLPELFAKRPINKNSDMTYWWSIYTPEGRRSRIRALKAAIKSVLKLI